MPRRWWVGSYSADMGGASLGIELLEERADGALDAAGLAAPIDSASFLLAHGSRVYAVSEGAQRVVSFRAEGATLSRDGDVESGGAAPCHLSAVHDSLIVSNYLGGSLGVIALDRAGAVVSLDATLPGQGSGPRPEQESPHLHASLPLTDGTVVAADLGADELRHYRLENDKFWPFEVTMLPPGTGPRDLALHPTGLLWMLGELAGVVHVFDASGGTLRELAATSLPGWVEGDRASALAFSADGQFAYAGVRGSNRVSVLRVSAGGVPEPVTSVSCEGDWPRHLVVDGDLLHIANERSHSVASFRLDADGIPRLIDTPTTVSSPTYLLAVGE